MKQKLHDFFLFGLYLHTHGSHLAKTLVLALPRHVSRLDVYAVCTKTLMLVLPRLLNAVQREMLNFQNC